MTMWKRHNCCLEMVIVLIVLQSLAALAGDPITTDNLTETKKLEAIPDKLVVLTFDDSSKSHFTVARPLLLKYRFGATFFITEGWDFATNKKDYMTWEEIQQLDRDGFEIGNHTRDHLAITDATEKQWSEQLQGIEQRCAEYGIPKPVSFAWPGNARTPKAFETLRSHGILFARRGGEPEFPYKDGEGVPYEPGRDHPYLLPSAGDARPNWELANFIRAVEQAKNGKIAILQFHGVPDTAHDWVSSSSDRFEGYLRFLAMNDYRVIALRDLAKYVDSKKEPENPQAIIEQRIKERPKSP
jgi:peptidoglycan/xylan/chitin deacetylase (PgdA/CDA1 family)